MDKACWVWLRNALGAGSSKQNLIFEHYASLHDFYEAGEHGWRLEGYFTQKELNRMLEWRLSDAEALIKDCAKAGQRVVTPEDEEYPSLLREMRDFPCALFVRGVFPDFSAHPPVAFVGTRDATECGVDSARKLSGELAQAGAVIVSGGAMGIDTASHEGALRTGGLTIAVLGCGLDCHYLMGNAEMRKKIAASGALVSEYPLSAPVERGSFPVRNRIISGLSLGTVVVEAAQRSGSLITARLASEQGRDVYAVPCGILNPQSCGVNNLLKDGAKPVTCARDILEEYAQAYPECIRRLDALEETVQQLPDKQKIYEKKKIVVKQVKANDPEEPDECPTLPADFQLSEGAKAAYLSLRRKQRHVSQLEKDSGLPVSKLLAALTELEISGLAASCAGQNYRLEPIKE